MGPPENLLDQAAKSRRLRMAYLTPLSSGASIAHVYRFECSSTSDECQKLRWQI